MSQNLYRANQTISKHNYANLISNHRIKYKTTFIIRRELYLRPSLIVKINNHFTNRPAQYAVLVRSLTDSESDSVSDGLRTSKQYIDRTSEVLDFYHREFRNTQNTFRMGKKSIVFLRELI